MNRKIDFVPASTSTHSGLVVASTRSPAL